MERRAGLRAEAAGLLVEEAAVEVLRLGAGAPGLRMTSLLFCSRCRVIKNS